MGGSSFCRPRLRAARGGATLYNWIHPNNESIIAFLRRGYDVLNLVEIRRPLPGEAALWQSYVGLYRDLSNMELAEMVTVRLQDGVLYVAEGEEEATGQGDQQPLLFERIGLV